ncbi:hypothetical protein HY409_03340 [Candidatus Gottesmanbacteria bacterium]|nr:hypothetical protein [Candidatus Gottesmanbacteria bacterium]
MHVITDLQLHSRFSRAVSPQMTIPNIASWARRKGIGLVATGDWMHPMWFAEIERDLEEMGNGLLRLRSEDKSTSVTLESSSFDSSRQGPNRSSIHQGSTAKAMTGLEKTRSPAPQNTPLFLLATEVSSIYSQGGKVRRVHTLIWVPSLESARKISQEMTKRGCNLMSDGRPIVGLSCIHIAELVLSIEPKALIIPAHAWTSWFSVYGSLGGFDSLEEAFGPFAKHIYAVETGLSSNPAMNWRIKELDHRSIVSFSDAHSGPKLGREATVFEVEELNYNCIYQAIKEGSLGETFFGDARQRKNVTSKNSSSSLNETPPPMENQNLGNDQGRGFSAPQNAHSSRLSTQSHNSQRTTHNSHIAYTIEFYPEEGKYHWSGHRSCGIRWGPDESKTKGTTCPVCGKPLTQGVEQRVGELAGRSEEELKLSVVSRQLSDNGAVVQMTQSKAFPSRPPFVMLVPLQEIIAECIGSPVASPKVQTSYHHLTDELGGEFKVLLEASLPEITRVAGKRIAAGVDKVRRGDLVIDPGYDGVFGVVRLWKEDEEKPLLDASKEQLSMFSS